MNMNRSDRRCSTGSLVQSGLPKEARDWARLLRKILLGISAALLVLAAAVSIHAQRLDGTLRVNVTDATGASIVDAKVTVTNEATNVSVSTDVSSEGTYVFPNLLVGTYTVTIEKDGFKKGIRKGVLVGSNQVSEAKIVLQLGAVSATVEVTSGADLVKTESSELGATFEGRVVNELPINTLGGSVLEYAVFAPGTTTQQGGVLGSGGSIGGTRPRFNGFSIDGVDDNKLDTNGPTQPVIQESVAEFTLLTNQFSAEYGHSAGGQFNITTKSGTNNWHGTGWEYNQNRNYNAFDNQEKLRGKKDRFDYNRAGASIGGPILKNELFVYGAYEFQNNGLASSSPTETLPTANGLALLNSMATHQAVKDILAQLPTAPTSNGRAHCNQGQNDPVHDLACVNGTPIDVGNIQSLAPNFTNEHDFIINTDLNLSKHRISGRFLYDRFRAPDFNASQPQQQFLGTNASDARKVIITDVWTVTNRLVNDFRSSYSRLNGPNLVVPGQFANFPNVEVDELGINVGPNGVAPQGYAQNIYQWADALTYIRGRHTVKGGLEARKYIAPTSSLPRARGEWDYATLNRFIKDLVPDGANKALRGAGSGSVAENYNAFYWFIQDDWKVTPHLTLNVGLRYEYTGVPRDENLQALNAIADDPKFGLFFRAPKPDTNNFAPRFGFAWDPTGSGKWAIRGGAAIAYDVTPNNFAINSLPPQLQTEQKPAITCALAGAPAWCTNPSAGFLQSGGLLTVNVPPTTQADSRAKTQSLIPDQVAPKVISWSLGIQHEIFRNTSVELRYLGTHSLSLPAQIRLNAASAFDPRFSGGGITPLPTFFKASDVPAAVPSPASTLANFDNFNSAPLSVDGFLGNVTTFPAAAQGIYHSGSVDVIHRLARGLYVRANYTYSRNIDNATNELFSSRVNPRRAQDGFDLRDERGRSALDIPQKFALTWVYDLPNIKSEHSFLRVLMHGWEVSGTYLAQKGQPVTVLSGADSNGNGDVAGDRAILNPNGVGLTGTTVNAVCNAGAGGATSIVGIDPKTGSFACGNEDDTHIVGYVAVDPSARFVQAQTGSQPNVGRNTISTPGLNIWNISLLKSTKIGERFTVQFRAESYDTFNHRNFSIGLPTNNGTIDQATNPNPLSSAYPFVTSGNLFLNNQAFNGGRRTMQLGLKLIF